MEERVPVTKHIFRHEKRKVDQILAPLVSGIVFLFLTIYLTVGLIPGAPYTSSEVTHQSPGMVVISIFGCSVAATAFLYYGLKHLRERISIDGNQCEVYDWANHKVAVFDVSKIQNVARVEMLGGYSGLEVVVDGKRIVVPLVTRWKLLEKWFTNRKVELGDLNSKDL